MTIDNPKVFIVLLCVIIAQALSDIPRCLAVSFTADLVQNESGEISTGKFFLQDHRYRMDIMEDGQDLSILVDQTSGKTSVLVPSEKAWIEIANSSMQSLMKNPFETFQHLEKKYKVRPAGQETVHGLVCEKRIISMDRKDVMVAWIARRYAFPVKITNPLNHCSAELKNIEEKDLSVALFSVPPGFNKMDKLPVPAPAWAGDIPGAPVLGPPFSRELSATEVLRIRPVKGYFVKLEMATSGDIPCQITAVGFKNGRPVRNPSYMTYTLSRKGEKILSTNKDRPGVIDEIVVRVTKGRATVRARLEEAPPEGIVLKKYRLSVNHGRQIIINHKKASHLIVQDDPEDGNPSRGTINVFATIPRDAGNGVTAYQNKRVETLSFRLADGVSRNWWFSRDRKIGLFGFNVMEGGVNIRIEQPERAGTVPPSWAGMRQPQREHPAQPVPARQKTTHSKVIFILDGSGSMWGQINGKPKIVIAKGVMDDLVDHLPPFMEVGLMAYGHRRKGDCTDIELLVPVGSGNPAALKARINALQPKGKTPLAAAVERAAQTLRYTEERATVVLVSDGLETCGADPCNLAEKLAMTGVEFTVHVIGFALTDEEQARLRCLADKTGGLFLAASDTGALRRALRKTVDKARQPAPVIRETPGKAELKASDTVPLGSVFMIQWQGPDSRGDYIAISGKGSKDSEYRDYGFTRSGNPLRMTAPGETGTYELRYVHALSGRVIGRRAITVVPVPAEVSAPDQVAAATEFEVQWKGPAHADDMITLVRPDQEPDSYLAVAYVNRGNPARLRAPADPGRYEVRYILGHGASILARTAVTVKTVTAVLKAPGSVAAGSPFEVHWQGPGNQDDLITIARSVQTPDSYLGIAYARGDSPAKLRAPADPGRYEVRYIVGHGAKILARMPITVRTVTAVLKVPGSVAAGSPFEVHWQGPGNPDDMIMLATPDQDATSYVAITYISRGNPVHLTAPRKPGSYEVRYVLLQGPRILARVPITIKTP